MSELFEMMHDLANAQAAMYRAAYNLGRQAADNENKERIETEDIPAKLAEDVGITE